jgi:hypothetical protein
MWRVGRKLLRTLYRDDVVVGMVDTPEIAEEIVEAMNARIHPAEQRRQEGASEPARKAVCGTCGGTGDAAYGPCPDCVTRKPCETCAEHGATMRQIHATCPECGSR